MNYTGFGPYPQNQFGQTMYGFNQPNYNQPNYQQPQAPQYPQNENVYAFVNGVEGAKSYQLRPNQSVMLMDSDQSLCYMKQSNAMGQSSLRYFRLTEISENEAKSSINGNQAEEYVKKADFKTLSGKVDELYRTVMKNAEKASDKE